MTQHETPKTPTPYDEAVESLYRAALDLANGNRSEARVRAMFAAITHFDSVRSSQALADHAAELAALQGIRGRKCGTCGGSGSVGANGVDTEGVAQWIDCPTCHGTGHEPLQAGSVAELVRAAYDLLAHHDKGEPMWDGLQTALAAFDLDEVTK